MKLFLEPDSEAGNTEYISSNGTVIYNQTKTSESNAQYTKMSKNYATLKVEETAEEGPITTTLTKEAQIIQFHQTQKEKQTLHF